MKSAIAKWIIILAAGLMPLATLSFSADYLQFDKVILLYCAVILAAGIFLADLRQRGEIKLAFAKFDGLLILFNIVYLVSSILGRDFFRSFWGSDLRLNLSYATMAALMLVYALSRYYFNDWKSFRPMLWVMAAAPILVGLYMIAASYLNLPLANLLADSNDSVNLIIAVSSAITAILFFIEKSRVSKIILGILLVLSQAVLLLADSSGAWLFLLVFVLIYILTSTVKNAGMGAKPLAWLTIYALAVTLAIIFPVGVWLGQPTVIDLQLPWLMHWPIAKGVLFEELLFGYGPQNFSQAFYAFKPLAFNMTPFWSLGFMQASTFFFEIMITTGILGAISWYGFWLGLLAAGWRNLKATVLAAIIPGSAELTAGRLLWSLLAALFLASFFSGFETYQLLTIFILSAATVSLVIKPEVKSFTIKPAVSQVIFYGGLLLILVGGYYLLSAKFSNYYLLNSPKSEVNSDDLNQMLARINKAERLNSGQAGFYISKANVLAAKIQTKKNEDSSAPVVEETKEILLAYDKAASLAVSYTDLLSLRDSMAAVAQVIESEDLKLAPVQDKLAQMDPQNPIYPLTQARDLLGLMQQNKNELNEESRKKLSEVIVSSLEKAIQLKPDLAEAYFMLGGYRQLSGDYAAASDLFLQSLSLDMTNQNYLFSLLQSYKLDENYEDLLAVSQRYLQDNNDDLNLLEYELVAIKGLGRDGEEVRELESKIEAIKTAQKS